MFRKLGLVVAVGSVGLLSLGAKAPTFNTQSPPAALLSASLTLPQSTISLPGTKSAGLVSPKEEMGARFVAAPGPGARPKPEPPKVVSKNPIQKHLKKNKILYRLDDRVDGSLRCDAWKVLPSKDDANQGILSFQYILKADQKKVAFTYGYQASFGVSEWLFSISGQEKVESYGGAAYRQTLSCNESYELGATRKGEFEIGEGRWYTSKSACEKARKAAAPKSPGAC
jgi:hypothetical protein